MIEEPKLLTIARKMRRPTAGQIAAFQNVPTGFVVDAMFGAGSLGTAISPIDGGPAHVAGPALTCDNRATDLLATLAALKFVRAGDVIMHGVQGHQGCAAAGDRVSGMLKNAGAVGLVTDGPMRDYEGVLEVGMPCWCTGLNPGSPYVKGPGKIGFGLNMGDGFIETGDMVVADRDGVVVVPFAQIEAVAARLPAIRDLEMSLDAEVRDGLVLPPSIAEILDGDDVEYL
jgi:4-hydroxy-4-methyl-2-oxoglutarate aldolase